MLKSILVSLSILGKFLRFSQEYKTRYIFEENINKNVNIRDFKILKFRHKRY